MNHPYLYPILLIYRPFDLIFSKKQREKVNKIYSDSRGIKSGYDMF